MASGRISGVCTGGGASKYDFWLEWSTSANEEGNYSLLNATAYVQRNDSVFDSAYDLDLPKENKYIEIDGERFISSEKGIDTRNFKKVVIAKVVGKRIDHNQDGTKSIVLSAGFFDVGGSNTNISLRSGSLEKKVFLDTLDSDPALFIEQPTVDVLSIESVNVNFSVDSPVDLMEYSIDGQKTWVTVGSVPFTIDGLSPHTQYQLYVRVRKATNKKYTVSNLVLFQTLTIYVESIELPDTFYVDIGQTVALPFTVYPENASIKAIEITSSDPTIISASDGKITGIKRGSALLTVKPADGGDLVYTLYAHAVRRVSGITISANDLTIAKDSVIRLAFNVLPADADNKNYTLQSSDESIVSVDGYNIIAIADGEAVVTAITEDGSFSASCNIRVIGDYTWYDYSEPLEVLNTEDVQHIHTNMDTIRNMLLVKGYSVADLVEVNPGKNTKFVDMLAILQEIEYNLDRISDNDCQSLYYVQPKVVGDRASNYNDIWRWIQVLNEMYLILTGTFGKWQYILLNDGYPTLDGRRLLIRGDKVG